MKYMRNRLEGELLSAKRERNPLIRDTQGAIGGVADKGYKALNKLPAVEGYLEGFPYDISATSPFSQDTRFFKARKLVRPTSLPDEPVVMDNQGESTIAEIATETFRRRHYIAPSRFGDDIFLQLPIKAKLVVVEFSEPEKEYNHTVSVSSKGHVYLDKFEDYTHPRAVESKSLTSIYDGYSSDKDLKIDYANKFTGALVVADFIAGSLSRTNGIESDRRELKGLQDAWQRVDSTQEMHPDIAALLPKKAK